MDMFRTDLEKGGGGSAGYMKQSTMAGMSQKNTGPSTNTNDKQSNSKFTSSPSKFSLESSAQRLKLF